MGMFQGLLCYVRYPISTLGTRERTNENGSVPFPGSFLGLDFDVSSSYFFLVADLKNRLLC